MKKPRVLKGVLNRANMDPGTLRIQNQGFLHQVPTVLKRGLWCLFLETLLQLSGAESARDGSC